MLPPAMSLEDLRAPKLVSSAAPSGLGVTYTASWVMGALGLLSDSLAASGHHLRERGGTGATCRCRRTCPRPR